jgi:hypothetical protein
MTNSGAVPRIGDIGFLLKFEAMEFLLATFDLGDSRGTEWFVTSNFRSHGSWRAVSFHRGAHFQTAGVKARRADSLSGAGAGSSRQARRQPASQRVARHNGLPNSGTVTMARATGAK